MNDLEGSMRGHLGFAYVIVDHFALASHSAGIKNLVKSMKFVVVVPLAVIQELDALKKKSGKVRGAIKWLEKEFKAGG